MNNKTATSPGSPRAVIQWAFGLATIIVTPSVYFYFNTFGSPFDSVFLTNFYNSPFEARLEPYAQLLGFALACIAATLFALCLRRVSGAIFPIYRMVISVLAVLYVLNFLRSGVFFLFSLGEALDFLRSGSFLKIGLVGIVILGALFFLVRFHRNVGSFLAQLIRAYSLIAVVFGINAISAIVVLEPYSVLDVKPVASAPANAKGDGRQFIWVIFDQADQGLIFDDRDPTVELPNLDRLRSRAIYTADMKSPRTDTFLAIPAITLGFKGEVIKRTPDGPDVELPDGRTVPWSEAPTIFSDVKNAGKDVILLMQEFNVGSFCRVFAGVTTKCWQSSKWRNYPISFQWAIIDSTARVFKRFVYSLPLVHLLAPVYFLDIGGYGAFPSQHYHHTLLTMQDEVVKEIGAPLDRDRLLYVHWNVPHQPYIYDRQKNELAEPALSNAEDAYKSNLELMDFVVGKMLDAIDTSPNAGRTTLLVTSDHGTTAHGKDVRTPNVPFILLSPDVVGPAEIKGNFNSSRTRQLMNNWLGGSIGSLEDIKRVLTVPE
jgi:hypothetical protein